MSGLFGDGGAKKRQAQQDRQMQMQMQQQQAQSAQQMAAMQQQSQQQQEQYKAQLEADKAAALEASKKTSGAFFGAPTSAFLSADGSPRNSFLGG